MPGAVKWTRICFRGGLRGKQSDSKRIINIPDSALFYDDSNIGSWNRECLGLLLMWQSGKLSQKWCVVVPAEGMAVQRPCGGMDIDFSRISRRTGVMAPGEGRTHRS